MDDIGIIKFKLQGELQNLRKGSGCLDHVHLADELAEFLGFTGGDSDEYRTLCLLAIIKHIYQDNRADNLLAALNLHDKYSHIKKVNERRKAFERDTAPEQNLSIATLTYHENSVIERIVDEMINLKESGVLYGILPPRPAKDATVGIALPHNHNKEKRAYKHNLPRRNPNYIKQREQIYSLDGIREGFAIDTKTPNSQVIYGMGGVGKTQLASAYVHHFRDEYPVICWLSADAMFGHAADFIKYMEPKEYERLQDVRDNASALVTVFRQWLENNAGRLLVIDDVSSQKQIELFIPQESKGHILLTSRSALKGADKAIHLDVFNEAEAVDFLVDSAKCKNRNDAYALSKRLGYFPLALEQAAAYIAAWPDVDFAKVYFDAG